jgi:hypothetical protein
MLTYSVLEIASRRDGLHVRSVAQGIEPQAAVDMRTVLQAVAPEGIDYRVVSDTGFETPQEQTV